MPTDDRGKILVIDVKTGQRRWLHSVDVQEQLALGGICMPGEEPAPAPEPEQARAPEPPTVENN